MKRTFRTLIRRSRAGFTLVETLVALTVLTVGLTAGYAAAVFSSTLATSIRNNAVAGNLAQEGAEIIRSIRDTNWFASAPFDTGLAAGDYEVVIYAQAAATPYQARPMYITPGGLYQYATGPGYTLTPFRRKISISKPSAVELRVVSEVTWTDRGRDREVAVESHLFDWK